MELNNKIACSGYFIKKTNEHIKTK